MADVVYNGLLHGRGLPREALEAEAAKYVGLPVHDDAGDVIGRVAAARVTDTGHILLDYDLTRMFVPTEEP